MMPELDTFVWALVVAIALDLGLGEPTNRWHPVAYLGQLIAWGERLLFVPVPDPLPAGYTDTNRSRGILLAVLVIGTAALAALGAERLIHWVSTLLLDSFSAPLADTVTGLVTALGLGIALKPCFALRGLLEEGLIQQRFLARHRLFDGEASAKALDQSRSRLRHLCSRNTDELSREEIAEVTISSMAENLCDSFVAPLLAFLCFGLPGAAIYRAINTLDAMVGYRGRYEFFGRASARLDDWANLLPARLTGYMLIVAGWCEAALGQSVPAIDASRGLEVMHRDHALTPSPNGGWPMAAMAGLLGVQLRKRDVYQLGDPHHRAGDQAIAASVRIAMWAAALVLILVIFLHRSFATLP